MFTHEEAPKQAHGCGVDGAAAMSGHSDPHLL